MNEPGAHNANKPFHPLNRRVVAWALLFSALFTLAMTAILIAID
jgi:hypothetical protein